MSLLLGGPVETVSKHFFPVPAQAFMYFSFPSNCKFIFGGIAMQVLPDVVEAAVQPGRNTNGNGADGKTNGAGQGRDLDPEPSTVPLRVAVNHERMANAAQESESAERGGSHTCMGVRRSICNMHEGHRLDSATAGLGLMV